MTLLQVTHKKLPATTTVRRQLSEIKSRDERRVVVVSDPTDVATIRRWKNKRDNRRIECDMIAIRDGVIYYAQAGDLSAIAEWECLFPSVSPPRCALCDKHLRSSRKTVECEQCHSRVCDGCSWNKPSSECSFCGRFIMSAYMKKRARCAKLIFAHHGFNQRQFDQFKAGKSVCVLRELSRDKPLDDYVDEMLKALGDRLYVARRELHAYID